MMSICLLTQLQETDISMYSFATLSASVFEDYSCNLHVTKNTELLIILVLHKNLSFNYKTFPLAFG